MSRHVITVAVIVALAGCTGAALPFSPASPSSTPTASPTASPTATASPSPTPTATSSPTPTPTPSPTPPPTATPSPTPTERPNSGGSGGGYSAPSPTPTPTPTPPPEPLNATVRFGLVSDIHYRDSGRQEITDGEDTERRLQQFTDAMNQTEPGFVAQLGDFADGEVSSQSKYIEYLDRAEDLTEDRLSVPWYDVMGNHEYRNRSWNRSATRYAVNESWHNRSDTWYNFTVAGYEFVVLNTAWKSNNSGAHRIPEEEVTWLNRTLNETSRPTFVFMHVPVSAGCGDGYDQAINQSRVQAALAADDEFVAGFFGHSHHCDAWDRLRNQTDEYGNVFYHVTAPHQWMDDATQVPWGVVTISEDDCELRFQAGGGVNDAAGYQTVWDQPLNETPNC